MNRTLQDESRRIKMNRTLQDESRRIKMNRTLQDESRRIKTNRTLQDESRRIKMNRTLQDESRRIKTIWLAALPVACPLLPGSLGKCAQIRTDLHLIRGLNGSEPVDAEISQKHPRSPPP